MCRRIIYIVTILTLLFSSPLSSRGQSEQVYLPLPTAHNQATGLHLSHSDSMGVELELNVPTYMLVNGPQGAEGTYKIALDGAGQTSEIGKPEMPVYSALIGLPADAQVAIQVISEVSEILPGHYNISPVPRADFAEEDATSGKFVYDRDAVAFASNALYPDALVRIVDDAWLRDQRVVRIELYPFQYNPLQGSLLWHKQLKVDVQFIGGTLGDSAVDISSTDDAYDAVLQGLVLNYDVARAWRGVPSSEIYHPESAGQTSAVDDYEPVFLGPRYKIAIKLDGLYRLTYEALQQIHPLSSQPPNTFHLYNQGRDVAIYVDDGGDGVFGSNDSIYFYGEQFRGDFMAQQYAAESTQWITLTEQLTDGSLVLWHPEFNHFMLEKYTDQNVYWLTVGGGGGPRMSAVNGAPTGSTDPIPATYQATVRAERELRHWEQSFTTEDTWYWEFVTDLNTHTYTTTLTGLASGTYTATIRGEIAAYSYNADNSPDHHTRFTLNNRVTPIDEAYWDGKSRYRFEEQVPQSDLVEGNNQLKFLNINDAFAYPMIMFDFFEVDFTRLFQAEQNKLIFPGENAGTWRYRVGGFSTSVLTVYDISNPISPIRVTNPNVSFTGGAYSVTFLATHEAGECYFTAGGYEVPDSLTYYQPPDFAAMTEGVDYLFISHSDFIPAAQAMVNYRINQGLSAMIVNVDDLYAEFFDGIFHPMAIKNFLAYTFAHWNNPPTYVLLIGDGNWHFKNTNPTRYGSAPTFMPPNLSWVDPWLGQTDSPNLLATVVGSDILPDVLIGRLPVSSSAELADVISKITTYEQSPTQTWQRNLLFIADDTPDQAGDFVYQSETIINEFIPPGYSPIRIYLDNYKDYNLCGTQPFPFGPTCSPVNRAITETVSTTGTLFVNYTGHAGTQYWTSDKILLYQVENPSIPNDYTINDIASMENGDKLPIVLSMTCWDGYWFYPSAHPSQPSLSEFWLRTSGRGAVAVFSATGLGVESGHVTLQEGFYGAIFNDGIWNLGLATLAAKLNIYQNGGNYDLINTYVTFGDPALQILNPYQLGLTPHASEGTTTSGGSVTYTFQVTNQGTVPDTMALSITNNDWPASFPLTVGPLAAGQSQSFDVTVHIPVETDGGETDVATLIVSSLGNRSRTDTVIVTTFVAWDRLFLPLVQK